MGYKILLTWFSACTYCTVLCFSRHASLPQSDAPTSVCLEARARIEAFLLHSQMSGSPAVGTEVPVCDGDGTYAAKQQAGSQSYCVTKNGTAIPGYSVNRWEDTGMNCQCARDQYEFLQTGHLGKSFRCDGKGNYVNIQCTGSTCYCVDVMGKMLGSAVDIAKMDQLTC